jgi:hypothetical protein
MAADWNDILVRLIIKTMQTTTSNSDHGEGKMEFAFLIGFLVLWFALQAWVLPRFGVST